ncbi:MAG: histidine kinase [Caldilineaceae bacterium]
MIVLNDVQVAGLAYEIEKYLNLILTLCDEPEEQQILAHISMNWGKLHGLLDHLVLEQTEAATHTQEIQQLTEDARQKIQVILSDLNHLRDLVNEEIALSASMTQFADTRMTFLLGVTFLLVVGSLVALWVFFSRMITYPIETLRVGVEQLRKGDWNYRLHLERDDELGVIAQSVNEIAARLQSMVGKGGVDKTENVDSQASFQVALEHTVRVQETERKRIAMDLHDGVNQWLVGTLLKLEAARVRVPVELAEVSAHLDEAKYLLHNVKIELQRTIHGMHPHLLKTNGLATTIRLYLADLHRHGIMDCTFILQGVERQLPLASELALFRVVQEGLNNVVKHADTNVATLTLTYEKRQLQLTWSILVKGLIYRRCVHK